MSEMARQHHCEQQGYVDDLERQLAEERSRDDRHERWHEAAVKELEAQYAKEREEDRAAIRKIEMAIRELPRLDHDFCIDYNVKQQQKRYDDRPWDEIAEDHREWHRLRTARATELLRAATALNSGSDEEKQ